MRDEHSLACVVAKAIVWSTPKTGWALLFGLGSFFVFIVLPAGIGESIIMSRDNVMAIHIDFWDGFRAGYKQTYVVYAVASAIIWAEKTNRSPRAHLMSSRTLAAATLETLVL